jgi:outer membrane protein assembly factor BamB
MTSPQGASVARDAARFWESNGGAGARHDAQRWSRFAGRTGIVNVLDARTGAMVWTPATRHRHGRTHAGLGLHELPRGHHLVVIAASGRLVAYERTTGTVKWTVKTGGGSYSSPQLMTIAGVEQIVLLNGSGATAVASSDGAVLWTDAWSGAPMLQPALTPDGDVLITSGDAMGGNGIRRLTVTRGDGKWNVEERWTSTGLKPYFNDYVVHNGHAYGFDGSILACIDLKDGTRKWKGGRYGHGQLVLLPDQDLMLVLSEEGELALVSATPEKFTEIARAPAIEGKTWNHPVLVNDVLLVRNGEEMAAFRLTRAGDTQD